jgi:phosphoribosylamine---glycine ligase
MKFVMISKCGEGAGLLHRIALEGNDVSLFVSEEEYRSVWTGILPQVTKIPAEKDAVYIFDSSGMGTIAEYLLSSGHKVFGASAFADELENDRSFGFGIMREAGILIPNYQWFDRGQFNKARQYIKQSKADKLVFKPCGDLPSNLTYVASDNEDLLLFMDYTEKHFGKEIDEFIIQDFVEGILVSSELWFDGQKASGFNQTVELKKLMNDDLGPSTGCSANTVWPCEEDNYIIENGVLKLTQILKREKYVGPIDLNAIIDKNLDIYGLEFTPRFGLDAMPVLMRMLSEDAGKVIHSYASGAGSLDFDVSYGSGVRLSIPPYPVEPKSLKDIKGISSSNVPVRIPERYIPDVYFYEVMMKDEQLVHSEGTGVILVALGTGDSVKESLKVPYEVLEAVKIPNKQYRTDCAEVLNKMYLEIEEVIN